jgi:hypothetical protein
MLTAPEEDFRFAIWEVRRQFREAMDFLVCQWQMKTDK